MTADSCGIQMGIINVMLDYELQIRKILLLFASVVRGAYEGKRATVPGGTKSTSDMHACITLICKQCFVSDDVTTTLYAPSHCAFAPTYDHLHSLVPLMITPTHLIDL